MSIFLFFISTDVITVEKWTEIFPGRSKFIHSLFLSIYYYFLLDRPCNFGEFLQLCIFFSNIDDELLFAGIYIIR